MPHSDTKAIDALPAVEEIVDFVDAYPYDGAREHLLCKQLRPALESGSTDVARLMQRALEATSDVGVRVDMLLILSTLPLSASWDSFVPLFRSALASSSLRVRDASVRALERLAVLPGSTLREQAFDLLRDHREPDAWLSDYVGRVIGGPKPFEAKHQ